MEEMKTDVQTLLIMAEVNEAAGDDNQADSSLTQASELQETILARSRCDVTHNATMTVSATGFGVE